MTRRLLGVLAIVLAVGTAGVVMYTVRISAGMPHGRVVNGPAEWALLGASLAVVAGLIWLGHRLLTTTED